jgi:uncharacterized membrane protein
LGSPPLAVRVLDRIDGKLTALNLIYLGFVAFLP